MKNVAVFIFVFMFSLLAFSQENSEEKIITDSKTIKTEKSDKLHSPRKATIMSAVLPGLGQIYNHKIWKVPIVYAGIGGFGYFVYYNHSEFNQFKKAYINRQNGLPDEFNGILSNQGLLNEMDRFRRYRDLCAFGFIAFYALQIIDANVDANLFDFDVSNDLSIQIKPNLIQNNYGLPAIGGICCTIKF